MAEKRTPPEPPGRGRRPKRTAPTIDLKATELPPPPEVVAESAVLPDPPAEAAATPETAAAPQSEMPPPPPPEEPQAAAPEPVAMSLPPEAGNPRFGMAMAAGFAGAAIVAGVLAALWYSGLLAVQADDSSRVQIAALEKQVQNLRLDMQQALQQAVQSRPAPAPTVDPKTIDALNQRVSKLQGDIAALPPGDKSLAERLTAAENAMRSLGVALTALNRRNDDLAAGAKQAQDNAEAAQKAVSDLRAGMRDAAKDASGAVAPAALDAVQQRVAALEQSLKSAQDEIARAAAGGKAARLAVAAATLRDAVESGAPYAPALAQAKSLGVAPGELAPLEPFAPSGLPSRSALAQELADLVPAMLKASGAEQTPSGGFLERLQANAGKLVRIRPVDAPAGDAAPDVLARVEVAAAKADIDGALADLAKLPEAARRPAEAWIAKAKAWNAARAAARRFAAASASALAQP